jgi:Na+/melibiose symporter-like transporter
VSEPKKRPGWLWLLFYSRRRRGFPWLLVGVLAAVFVFALLFAIPSGSGASWIIAGAVFGSLIIGALGLAIVAALFPRRRH